MVGIDFRWVDQLDEDGNPTGVYLQYRLQTGVERWTRWEEVLHSPSGQLVAVEDPVRI